MTGGKDVSGKVERDERRAAALRQNLKRRKEQARARAEAPSSGEPDITCFFHEPSFTATYLVVDPSTRQAAIIDSVLDYDGASGRTRDRKSTRLNSSHVNPSRMPSSA